MANKPNINTIDTLSGMNVIKKQKQIECSTLASNSKTVLSVSAVPVLEKCEREGKFIKIEGVAYIKILYEDNDGNNCVIDNKCNFAEIVDAGDNAGEFSCLGDVTLSDLEFSLSNADEIKLSAVLNFEICVFKESQANYVECNSDDFCILPNEVHISTCIKSGTEDFAQSYEVDLGKNVARVLDCYATLSQKGIQVENGSMIIDMSICNTIVYEQADENNTICNHACNYDFKQTINIEGCHPDCQALAKVHLLSDRLQVVCEDVEGSMLAHIDYPMLVQYIVLQSIGVQSVLDAYSTTNEISLTRAEQGAFQVVGDVVSNEKIDTNVTLEDENKTIEKLYSYTLNSIDLTKLLVDNDCVIVEGVAYCNIIYQSFDRETELKNNASIVAEIPFSTRVSMANLNENDILLAKAYAVSTDVRIKRSQELDIIAEIRLHIVALRNVNVELICDVEIGDIKTVNSSALNVYVVQPSMTYWDIAKQLSVNVDELQKQNQDVSLPSTNIERVVFYKQLI